MQERARMTASDWLLTDQMHSTWPPGNLSLGSGRLGEAHHLLL